MIATDHAPHSAEEKGRGLEKSAFGITGIELALPLMNTYMVRTGIITLDKLVDLLVYNPRERFGLPNGDSFSIWKLDEQFKVEPERFISKGKATPFDNYELYGKCYATVYNGKIVYKA